MSSRDWAETPLGPPETWPPALRSLVRIVLTSRFSMWAAWGPELIAFYNDAYMRDTLQAKHPWALGRPAREMWAEIWHDIGPRIRSVLDTGVATWDEDLLLFLERGGYPEETYHTFSYSPVDDEGRTAGMLCVVTENTQRVLGERRMATLRDLAAALADTRTEADVLAGVAEQLGRNRADLPFSVTYLFDESGQARLGCAAGIEPGTPGAPERIADDGLWPLLRIRAGEQVVLPDLGDRLPGLPTGAWSIPPVEAVAVPITSTSQGAATVAGFLVVGLNPHRRLDDDYRGFLELLASQIASGLVNAGSYEAERRRAESLAELDRAKTDFFSNVSHEFRTPLTLITGPLAELRTSRAITGDARLREEIDVIERNAQRLGRLVTTLLDFSRIQAGRIDARYKPVDLAETTSELASVFRSAITRAGLELTVDCPPLGEPVHVDRDMWEKVVLNLLSNALKFTFTGGITVRLHRVDGAVELTVADTGTGIPAEELPRLFERFHRVATTRGRSGEGSGIGLAMVRELVGLHGGTVDVASTPEVGTTFRVRIPLGTAHLPAERVVAPGAAPGVSPAAQPFVSEVLRWLPDGGVESPTGRPAPAPIARSGRVLVADDNSDMREYLQRLLRPHYAVQAVSDGEAARQAILTDPPDLVISDVMMPGLDGMQLLAALRADPRTNRIPVLLLSARAGQEAAVEGLAAGADDYLVKPFSAPELLARVSAHLQLGRVRREAEERFTAMADVAPALIWLSDHRGRRTFVNRGWRQFTGHTVDEELGSGWLDGLHPEDREAYELTVAKATAGQRGWEAEFRLRRADGAYHWLLERAVPLGVGTEFAGYVGSCTDINARYRETERQTLLARVGAALDRETDVDRQLSQLARLMVSSRLADVCSVRLVGEDGELRLAGIAGLDEQSESAIAAMNQHAGIGPAVAASGSSVIQDAERPDLAVARDEASEDLARRLGLRSGLAVPLTVRGRTLAVLGLARRAEAPSYNDDDRSLAEEIAARAALAADNALLLAEERAAAHRLALLQRATAELSAATTPVDVGRAAGGHIRQLTGPQSRVGVYELDAAHRALTVLTISGGGPANQALWSSIPLQTPLAVTTAVAERRAIWIEDLEEWPGAAGGVPTELVEALRSFGLSSTVALPLTVAGRVVGVIGIGFAGPRRFPAIERSMLLAVAEQCAQALDRARLYRAEQGIASTLQLSLLPAQLPRLEGLSLAAHYLPGAEGSQAGGDWYDVVELDESRVAIAVGDVVGQGPAAAAVMGQLRSALSAALLGGSRPADALELLDRFASRLPGALASSAACVVVDRDACTVTWARAGHPPPLLITPDGSRVLDGSGAGPVLGASRIRPYADATADITPGTTLLLYTDGLVERRGEVLDDGLARVMAAAERHAGDDPVRLTRRLLADVLADTDQPDDVALIAARLLPGPLAERIPADPGELAGMRRTVARWAAAAALPDEAVEDLQLALGEAMANAVEHAYAGTAPGICEYRVSRAADGDVDVQVTDFGRWRPPPADRGHRGRGLELISALAAEVAFTHPVDGPDGGTDGSSGTSVRFRIRVSAEDDVEAEPARVAAASGVVDGEPARLTVHDEPDGVRLAIAGELDLASAGSVGAAVRERLAASPAGVSVALDLRPTTYLASAGVGLVLQAVDAAAARGVRFSVLIAPGSPPARLLALAGLDDIGTHRSGDPGD